MISGSNARHVFLAYDAYESSLRMEERRSRFCVLMPFVDGSALSMPSFSRRMRSGAEAAVEKKPDDDSSQKRDNCVSVLRSRVSYQVEHIVDDGYDILCNRSANSRCASSNVASYRSIKPSIIKA